MDPRGWKHQGSAEAHGAKFICEFCIQCFDFAERHECVRFVGKLKLRESGAVGRVRAGAKV